MNQNHFVAFETWADVLTYAESGQPLFYHAPLDYRPLRVYVRKVFKNGKLRVDPMINRPAHRGSPDPFTADSGHLDRFRKFIAG